jgi:hypothetical protein
MLGLRRLPRFGNGFGGNDFDTGHLTHYPYQITTVFIVFGIEDAVIVIRKIHSVILDDFMTGSRIGFD